MKYNNMYTKYQGIDLLKELLLAFDDINRAVNEIMSVIQNQNEGVYNGS